MTCIFLGTSTFAIPSAVALRASVACTLLGIVTKPDEPIGRNHTRTPPPLAVWARVHNVPLWQPATKGALVGVIREHRPDVAVVVTYGNIIPPEALALPRFGFVNLHPSLLPKYRGPSPIQTTIANGDAATGVSLILLDAKIDHGPLLAQERVPIPTSCSRSTLETLLADRGAALLTRTLPSYLAGRVTPIPQDDAAATMTTLLAREHGHLNWKRTASDLERLVRAYEEWPGTWCMTPSGKRLKVLAAHIGTTTNANPGTVLDSSFRVACGNGTTLILDRVQLEGAVMMDGRAFLRGARELRNFPIP